MAWSDKFDHPIKWGARSIDTLNDARVFILEFPGLHRSFPSWLSAYTVLSQAAELGGPWRDLARIEIMNALLGSIPDLEADKARHWQIRGTAPAFCSLLKWALSGTDIC
jgi:hypothetical protein